MSSRGRTVNLCGIVAAAVLSLVASVPAAAAPAGTQATQTFQNRGTGRCLDDSIEFGVRAYGCNYGPYQQWIVKVWPDGTRRLTNVMTQRCIMDMEGIGIGVASCDDSTAESWFVHQGSENSGIMFINQRTTARLRDVGGRLVSGSLPGGYERADEVWY